MASRTSATMSALALQLKDEGNQRFKAQDYAGADALYSKAIIADPNNPALYTNRALARLKLSLWDSVVADCEACLAISPDNMKALYTLSQAQLALGDYDSALATAQLARERHAAANDRSLPIVTAHVLRCRKERWDDREKRRVREEQALERDVLDMMARSRREAVAAVADDEAGRKEADTEWDAREASLRAVFERARTAADRRREVPDWAIDDITFGIMIDPVVTKSGKSYERASIVEHLRRHETDPITREPLTVDELRPNLNLKHACEMFLEENGWAVDW